MKMGRFVKTADSLAGLISALTIEIFHFVSNRFVSEPIYKLIIFTDLNSIQTLFKL